MIMPIRYAISKTYKMYSGTRGLYASVVPTRTAVRRLLSFLDETKLVKLTPADIEELHVTTMYAVDGIPKVGSISHSTRIQPKGQVKAHLVKIDWWQGHDNSGYLVGKLESPGLMEMHNHWRHQGAKHSFNEYVPHITIKTPYPKPKTEFRIVAANVGLQECPVTLTFENEVLEDIT